MAKLKDLLQKASRENYALGHFNFSTLEILNAIVSACKNFKSSVFIGTSEGEAKFVGYKQAVALTRAWREESGLPVFLNADHHKSFESAKTAINAGYDSVQIDGASLSIEKNIEISRRVVEYARGVNPDISVEGELGYIRGSSQILKEEVKIDPKDMTTPEGAREFIEKTGVDRLAVVFGNIHGISSSGNPRLDIERLKSIHETIPQIPLTLHGGSGISDEDIRASLIHGMSNIHVNTEIRVAYSGALRVALDGDREQMTPYKYLEEAREAVQKVVEEKLGLFGAVGLPF